MASIQKAMEYLEVTKSKETSITAMKLAVDSMVRQLEGLVNDPAFRAGTEAFKAKAEAQMDELLASIAANAAAVFTDEELDATIAFYKTPVGQKFIELQPQLQAQNAMLGEQWGRRVEAELANILKS